tara:strand:- start:290 stop:1231 length:942 start_codon:yes stop_codon:yes gene_type:complete
MKKRFTLFCLLVLSVFIHAQQLPITTNYLLNRFAINPAIAGIKPCSETNLGHRNQWTGIENAPETFYAAYNSRWNRKDKYPDELIGYGINIVNDKVGFVDRTYIRLAYSYHIKLWKAYRLSFGIYAGIQQYSFSYNSVNIPNKGIDPAVKDETETSLITPEVSPGIFMYNKNFFLGLSSFQIFPTRMYKIGTNDQRLSAHYYFMGGYRLRGQFLHYIPSFLLSFSPYAPPTADISLTMDYKSWISIAAGSKYLNSAYAIINFKIAPPLTLGYVYEYGLNEINRLAPNTHEFTLSFATCYTEKTEPKFFCPAYQ